MIEHRHADGTSTWEYDHAAAITRMIGNTDHPVDPVLYDPATMELVGVCDFCSTPGPRWKYPAHSYVDERAGYASIGEWGACQRCHDLIEKGDDRSKRELVRLALERFPEPVRRQMRAGLAEFQAKFFANRTGPAEAQW